ncbi:hypothetical protein L210DRAFT_3576935 [Boletus edulis BED1]|uniref:Uncharacterized protein n=1 Tax=Boletus edulis BED1 TaxID=1328754 RepID=A0AAD4BD47_BOLED|nr:hypothetical protein L210DRAFT_3576935 [Boletus edulis BED1]
MDTRVYRNGRLCFGRVTFHVEKSHVQKKVEVRRPHWVPGTKPYQCEAHAGTVLIPSHSIARQRQTTMTLQIRVSLF